MFVCAPVEAFAATSVPDAKSSLPEEAVAWLVNDLGESVPITGTLISNKFVSAQRGSPAAGVYSLNENQESAQTSAAEVQATYEFPVTYAALSLNTSQSDTKTCMDGALAVRAYLTINYTISNEEPYLYLLTRVSGHWTVEVTNVNVTSATLVYGCNSFAPSIIQNQRATVNVSNYFNRATNFTRPVADIYAAVGANLTLKLQMGTTRTWDLYLQNNCCG